MRSILSILLLALTTTAGAETWVRCGDSVEVAEGARGAHQQPADLAGLDQRVVGGDEGARRLSDAPHWEDVGDAGMVALGAQEESAGYGWRDGLLGRPAALGDLGRAVSWDPAPNRTRVENRATTRRKARTTEASS